MREVTVASTFELSASAVNSTMLWYWSGCFLMPRRTTQWNSRSTNHTWSTSWNRSGNRRNTSIDVRFTGALKQVYNILVAEWNHIVKGHTIDLNEDYEVMKIFFERVRNNLLDHWHKKVLNVNPEIFAWAISNCKMTITIIRQVRQIQWLVWRMVLGFPVLERRCLRLSVRSLRAYLRIVDVPAGGPLPATIVQWRLPPHPPPQWVESPLHPFPPHGGDASCPSGQPHRPVCRRFDAPAVISRELVPPWVHQATW